MSRGSRSPKRDRYHRSSHRERSRDRDSPSGSKHKKHRKSSRDRDEKRKHRSEKIDYKEVRVDSVSVKRYDSTQRGIDAARNRLRASLSTAITDFKEQDQPRSNIPKTSSDYDFSDSVSVFDSLNRQKAIEEIDQPGFVSSRFTSGNNEQSDIYKTRGKKGPGDESADVKIHERAMFGALWTSNEIERKLGKTVVKDETPDDNDEDVKIVESEASKRPEESIAHERLSADPAVRQAKWLEIFRNRRKALIEGIH